MILVKVLTDTVFFYRMDVMEITGLAVKPRTVLLELAGRREMWALRLVVPILRSVHLKT